MTSLLISVFDFIWSLDSWGFAHSEAQLCCFRFEVRLTVFLDATGSLKSLNEITAQSAVPEGRANPQLSIVLRPNQMEHVAARKQSRMRPASSRASSIERSSSSSGNSSRYISVVCVSCQECTDCTIHAVDNCATQICCIRLCCPATRARRRRCCLSTPWPSQRARSSPSTSPIWMASLSKPSSTATPRRSRSRFDNNDYDGGGDGAADWRKRIYHVACWIYL